VGNGRRVLPPEGSGVGEKRRREFRPGERCYRAGSEFSKSSAIRGPKRKGGPVLLQRISTMLKYKKNTYPKIESAYLDEKEMV